MKLTKILAASVAASSITSCASFNGDSRADMNHDGVVSAVELRAHIQRIEAGEREQEHEARRFEHIDNMIGIGERILNRFQR